MTEYASWNFRVVSFPESGPEYSYLTICEVYYDRDENVSAWCEASIGGFETTDDLVGTLKLMLEATGPASVTLDATLLPGYEEWKSRQ